MSCSSRRTNPLSDSHAFGLDGGSSNVSCGHSHVCAIGPRDAVFCWGNGSHYKLGNHSTADVPLPVLVGN